MGREKQREEGDEAGGREWENEKEREARTPKLAAFLSIFIFLPARRCGLSPSLSAYYLPSIFQPYVSRLSPQPPLTRQPTQPSPPPPGTRNMQFPI
jgi:hypothetical protein